MDNFTKSDNSTLIKTEDEVFNLSNIIIPFLVLWYCVFIIKMLIKYKDKMEPSHIIELNAMLDVLILNVCRFLQTWDSLAFGYNLTLYCWVLNFVTYFARFLLHTNIAAAEINRSLFVYLGNQYYTYVREAIT